ncbi:hypothetical protein KAR48_09310 [bacterium]|nr:hypothetical protein [bacterium]
MRRKRSAGQGDLFAVTNQQDTQNRIRELDKLIASALKKNDYQAAKNLTQEQEILIQKMVESGDESGADIGEIS